MLTRAKQYLLPCTVLFSGILMAAPSAGLNDQAIARTAPIVRSLMSKKIPDDPYQLAVVTAELELLGLKTDAATLKDISERRIMDIALGQAQPKPPPTIQAALASERQSSISLDEAKQHFASTAFPVDFTRTAVSDKEIERANSWQWTRELNGLWVENKSSDILSNKKSRDFPAYRFAAAVIFNHTKFRSSVRMKIELGPNIFALCTARNIEPKNNEPIICQIKFDGVSIGNIHQLMIDLKAGVLKTKVKQMNLSFGKPEHIIELGPHIFLSHIDGDPRQEAQNLVRAASCTDLDNCGKQRRATLANPQLWHLGILALFMGLTMMVRFHSVARHRATGWPKGIWLAYTVVVGLVSVLSMMDPVTGHGYDGMLSTWAQVLAGMPWTAVSLDAYSSAQTGPAAAPPAPWIFMVVNFFYLSFMTFYRSEDADLLAPGEN